MTAIIIGAGFSTICWIATVIFTRLWAAREYERGYLDGWREARGALGRTLKVYPTPSSEDTSAAKPADVTLAEISAAKLQ